MRDRSYVVRVRGHVDELLSDHPFISLVGPEGVSSEDSFSDRLLVHRVVMTERVLQSEALHVLVVHVHELVELSKVTVLQNDLQEDLCAI